MMNCWTLFGRNCRIADNNRFYHRNSLTGVYIILHKYLVFSITSIVFKQFASIEIILTPPPWQVSYSRNSQNIPCLGAEELLLSKSRKPENLSVTISENPQVLWTSYRLFGAESVLSAGGHVLLAMNTKNWAARRTKHSKLKYHRSMKRYKKQKND